MKIVVSVYPGHEEATDEVTFENVGGWHMDGNGALHIKGAKHGDGNVATFHPSAWHHVVEKKNPQPDVTMHVSNVDDAQRAMRLEHARQAQTYQRRH